MDEIYMKVKKIGDLKEKLVCLVEQEMSKGAENICTEELGQVIDMIKDLAEAEEKCFKACYYHKIVESMDEYSDESERFGYIKWPRIESSDQMPDMNDYNRQRWDPMRWPHMPHLMRMGYPDDDRMPMSDRRQNDSMRDRSMPESRWDRYQQARRHYTESQSPESMAEMTKEAREYVQESVDTMRDIWVEADPELKKKMKTDIMNLMREMGM